MVDSNTSDAKGSDAHETNESAENKAAQKGQELDTDASLDGETDPVTLESGH